ncbi:MAG TPA: hypothetical protein DCM08_11135, partial [Microscillaceae bacterium]|nr:hypothetical protein [Microscillaceae bacterium]
QGIQQGIEQGIQQGIEQGKNLGIIESQKQMVIRMLELNLPLEQIVAVTNLSIAAIQAIQNEQDS